MDGLEMTVSRKTVPFSKYYDEKVVKKNGISRAWRRATGFNAYVVLCEGTLFSRDMSWLAKQISEIITISFPKTVTQVGENAFSSMVLLQSAVLNEGMQRIDSGAFVDCSVRRVSFPSTLSKIQQKAF